MATTWPTSRARALNTVGEWISWPDGGAFGSRCWICIDGPSRSMKVSSADRPRWGRLRRQHARKPGDHAIAWRHQRRGRSSWALVRLRGMSHRSGVAAMAAKMLRDVRLPPVGHVPGTPQKHI